LKAALVLFVSELGKIVINDSGKAETDEQDQIWQECTAAA
jgi:hypothetical protein